MMIEELFKKGIIKLAEKPKNNALDINSIGDKKLVLIPIDHDYPGGSAAMHNAVFDRYNLNYRTAFVVAKPNDISVIIQAFRDDPIYVGGGMGSGFKDKAPQFMDELDESAKILGSINVVKKQDGKLIGYNTDGTGFVNGLLKEYPNSIQDKKIVILGAGGTTLPVAYELARKSPKKIVILNRTVEKAEKIAKIIQTFTKAEFGGEEDISKELFDADIVINTSNKGAHPYEKYSAFGPITHDYNLDMQVAYKNLNSLKKSAIVADILLEHDLPTLKMAQNSGYKIHHGKNMNLYQAIPAIKIMTGIDIPDNDIETVMRLGLDGKLIYPRNELWIRLAYSELVKEEKLTTVFRPGDRTNPYNKGFNPNETVTIKILATPGNEEQNIPPLFGNLEKKVIIESTAAKKIDELTKEDFAGGLPIIKDAQTLRCALGLEYNKDPSTFNIATVTKFRYVK